eukprot:PLAT7100.1.p1 GENE.PLAT7100.1~~PLAT7100.1.p1  ORF type:complete len:546 (-),score=72.01 PLAT7100.1:137-1774(-)
MRIVHVWWKFEAPDDAALAPQLPLELVRVNKEGLLVMAIHVGASPLPCQWDVLEENNLNRAIGQLRRGMGERSPTCVGFVNLQKGTHRCSGDGAAVLPVLQAWLETLGADAAVWDDRRTNLKDVCGREWSRSLPRKWWSSLTALQRLEQLKVLGELREWPSEGVSTMLQAAEASEGGGGGDGSGAEGEEAKGGDGWRESEQLRKAVAADELALKDRRLGEAGTTVWGSRTLVEYQLGNIPVIFTIPHGGYLTPGCMPDRVKGKTSNCVLINDVKSLETAKLVIKQFSALLPPGFRPYVIASHIRRSKMDPNRSLLEATQGLPVAEDSWRDYHGFVEHAKKSIEEQFGRGHLFDMHGQGHAPYVECVRARCVALARLPPWLVNALRRLGYCITGAMLHDMDSGELVEQAATVSGPETITERCSVRGLHRHLCESGEPMPFMHLIWGELSLGAALNKVECMACPSPGMRTPEVARFMAGAYTARTHGSRYDAYCPISATQVEMPRRVRVEEETRQLFAPAMAAALLEWLTQTYADVGPWAAAADVDE